MIAAPTLRGAHQILKICNRDNIMLIIIIIHNMCCANAQSGYFIPANSSCL